MLYVLALGAIAAWPPGAVFTAFFAMSIFGVGTAAVDALLLKWWRNAALSVAAWLALFVALAATAEAFPRGRFGEGGMILLLPMMGFPVALAVSGLVRWWRGPSRSVRRLDVP